MQERILESEPMILTNPYKDEVKENNPKHGTFVNVRTEEKIGRNEQCPCGSGKKYKKCCIK